MAGVVVESRPVAVGLGSSVYLMLGGVVVILLRNALPAKGRGAYPC